MQYEVEYLSANPQNLVSDPYRGLGEYLELLPEFGLLVGGNVLLLDIPPDGAFGVLVFRKMEGLKKLQIILLQTVDFCLDLLFRFRIFSDYFHLLLLRFHALFRDRLSLVPITLP